MPSESHTGGLGRMLGGIASVGFLTLASRGFGFLRDVLMAAVLGAGPITDAFLVAFRLPNHFRAIFAEGAFNVAFVPAYARIHTQRGDHDARLFADRIFTLMMVTQLVLLVMAYAFMPWVIRIIAPGFDNEAGRFALAVDLTRITFPYLLLMTLVTLFGGILNALGRFAAAAAAPILLNLTMIVTLALAAFFPTAGHAAAWGVLISGVLQVLLVGGDAFRVGGGVRFCKLRWDEDVKRFFKALGPATVGSMGVQLAVFADTIIASFLPAGALSALYYADRLNQLPVGVIGIAVGTVLLPEMANRIAAGDDKGARHAQNRAIELTLLLSLPCLAAFLVIPDLVMRALFARGAFTAADAANAGRTLAAYAVGLLPFVLVRSLVATFLARGDTATAVKASLTGVAVNVGFKILLMGPLAQVGLALATAIGAWVNILLLMWFGWRAGLMGLDSMLKSSLVKLAIAGGALAAAIALAQGPVLAYFGHWPSLRDEASLGVLMVLGGIVYGGLVLALFGRGWLDAFRRRRSAASAGK